MNANIERCNYEILEQQKKQLFHEILYGENAGYFKVFDIEAGCRKTRTAEEALVKLAEQGDMAIFVRLTNEDCRSSMKRINELAGEEIAFAYNNEDVPVNEVQNYNHYIKSVPILIITHQKYRVLMKDKRKCKNFIDGRKTLVIDEFLSDMEKISLGEAEIETFRQIFSFNYVLQKQFEDALRFLITHIKYHNDRREPRGLLRIRGEGISKTHKKFILLKNTIKANITTKEQLMEWVEEIRYSKIRNVNLSFALLDSIDSVDRLCKIIDSYEQFYKNICVYYDKKLYTTDERIHYLFLDNNIMLDASGILQTAYDLNHEEFLLQKYEKVLDYGKWIIKNIPVTTTTSRKEKYKNYYDVINAEIKKYGNDILVIGRKNEMDYIDIDKSNKDYFGNITGRNSWYDKKHIAIIQTHNLNDIDYILQYIHYSKGNVDIGININGKTTGRCNKTIYGFKNSRLEKIRTQWIAAETYQAIKRINRNMRYESEVLVFMNNKAVIDLLVEQMKNINITIKEIDDNTFEMEKTKQDEYIEELKQKSYATDFINLMLEVLVGKHKELIYKDKRMKKKDVREYLGINDSSNFSSRVLNKSEIIEFLDKKGFKLERNYIVLP